jgi:hypothetical protein
LCQWWTWHAIQFIKWRINMNWCYNMEISIKRWCISKKIIIQNHLYLSPILIFHSIYLNVHDITIESKLRLFMC